LFPIKAMASVFRGKMIDALKAAYAQGKLKGFDDFEDPEGFARLVRVIACKRWIVYAKPTFGRAEHVLAYLGRYTHRVGISNSRLVDVSATRVTFHTRGEGLESLAPVTFLRRFVQHVLPDGFHKIRHIGLHASTEKRKTARKLLQEHEPTVATPPKGYREKLLELGCDDVARCPVCGGLLRRLPLPDARAPPEPTT
jgi:hypothetical protein